MAKFRVDSEVLQSQATEVRALKSEYESLIARLEMLVNGLGDIWEGQAYESFLDNYEEMKSTFADLAEQLEDVAADLDADAAIYADAEAQAASNTGR